MSEKSEVIAKFSTNPEVMERVDKLWNLHGQDNSTVEALLQGIAGKEEDAIIVELDHEIDKVENRNQILGSKMGGSKKRRNSNKNKKSRRNKKSNKRRRNRK